jgi:hypothetical protein
MLIIVKSLRTAKGVVPSAFSGFFKLTQTSDFIYPIIALAAMSRAAMTPLAAA